MAEINLDQQAGGYLSEEVWDSMLPFLQTVHHPGSLHRRGLRARAALAKARSEVADFLGAANPEEIFFAPSSHEAFSWAGDLLLNQRQPHDQILLSEIETSSVWTAMNSWQRQNFRPITLPVDSVGRVVFESLSAAINPTTALVCLHGVNEELGTIQPIAPLAELCTSHQIPLLIDATAAQGWLPINVSQIPITALTLNSERMGGPQGVAALYLRRGKEHLNQKFSEAFPESTYLAGIVGLGTAARVAQSQMAQRLLNVQQSQRFIHDFVSQQMPNVHLLGPPLGPDRIGYHLNLAAPGAEGEALALKLDLQGFSLASRPACRLRDQRLSPVLNALKISPELSTASILLTLGHDLLPSEMVRFCLAYQKSVEQLRRLSGTHLQSEEIPLT